MGNKLISGLDPYQKTEGILSKAGFTGFYVFFLSPDILGNHPFLPRASTFAPGLTALKHCFRLRSGMGRKAAKRLGDFLQTE